MSGNSWVGKHKEELGVAAAVAAAIAAPYLLPAMGAAGGAAAGAGAALGAGEAAAGAGLTAAELAALDAATVGYTGAGSLAAAEVAGGAGAAGAGLGAADLAYLDAMGGYTPAMGAADGAANFWGSGALLGEAPLGSTLSAMELEAGGGGTGGLLGTGTASPADSMSAAKGMSAWDRIGKGLDTYNKYSKIAGTTQGLLAPPQQPQAPQPRPLTQRQAQSQAGPVDWGAYFGQELSDEEIRRRYQASLNGYYG